MYIHKHWPAEVCGCPCPTTSCGWMPGVYSMAWMDVIDFIATYSYLLIHYFPFKWLPSTIINAQKIVNDYPLIGHPASPPLHSSQSSVFLIIWHTGRVLSSIGTTQNLLNLPVSKATKTLKPSQSINLPASSNTKTPRPSQTALLKNQKKKKKP